MFFLTLSNATIQFVKKDLIWEFYNTVINKKEFTKMVLNKESEIFIMHIAALKALLIVIVIYSATKAQIAFPFTKKVTI